MKNLLVTAILCISMCFLSSCGNNVQQDFKYEADTGDPGNFEEVLLTEPVDIKQKVNIDLLTKQSGSFICNEDEASLYFSGTTNSEKFSCLFTSCYTNVAKVRIQFKFDDGGIEDVEYDKLSLLNTTRFDSAMHSGKLVSCEIEMSPADYSITDVKEFTEKGDLELLSGNTIRSNINGSVAILDTAGIVKDIIDVEKGKTYVVSLGASSYFEFKGEEDNERRKLF